MKLVPKIKISDKATWIDTEIIALSALEMNQRKSKLRNEYFSDKTIFVLPIIPDDFYLNLEETIGNLIGVFKREKLILVSNDCACYNDRPNDCNEEIIGLEILNDSLFEKFNIDVGLLKGYNETTYRNASESLKKHVKAYMVYLTGEIRSNPKYFNVCVWLSDIFPHGLDKPLILHGCPLNQIERLQIIAYDITHIITAGFITDAIFRGNRAYKRETRIKRAWKHWKYIAET